jgi:branched-chain amino acid transport system substrate-binding protein
MVADLTGACSPNYTDSPQGAQARIDLQNAQGGIAGHPIKLIYKDSQCSYTSDAAAVNILISKGVLGIITSGSFSLAGTKIEAKAGVPESAVCPCSPDYAHQPYRNLFAYGGIAAPTIFNKLTYTNTVAAQFLKNLGAKKMAGLGYGIAPASVDAVKEVFAAAKTVNGPTQCYTDYSVPFGNVDFTAQALQIKASGCDAVTGAFVESSDIALAQAIQNQGIKPIQLYFTGYDQALLNNPAAKSAFQGVYALTGGPNFTDPNAATQSMMATLSKYDPSYKGGIPDLGLWGSYVATDLLIKGMLLAGANPTRSEVIDSLRNVDSYNAGGLLPTTVSFRNFGTPAMIPQRQCSWVMQLVGSRFVTYGGAPICGQPVGVPGLAS